MKVSRIYMAVVLLCLFGNMVSSSYADRIIFDFEKSEEAWQIPDWAYEQSDYVAIDVRPVSHEGPEGSEALEVICRFPGNEWTAALVEIEKDMDLSGYSSISAEIYVPRGAPSGFLNGRIILTAGVGWHFIEMRNAVPLIPGKWVAVEASLREDDAAVSAWKGARNRMLSNNVDAVRKIAVRVEYNAAPPHVIGSPFHGSVYIRNVVIEK